MHGSEANASKNPDDEQSKKRAPNRRWNFTQSHGSAINTRTPTTNACRAGVSAFAFIKRAALWVLHLIHQSHFTQRPLLQTMTQSQNGPFLSIKTAIYDDRPESRRIGPMFANS